jgi:hypothetical protein
MCGCRGASWSAPKTMAEVRAARNGATAEGRIVPKQTRELIPGGYWNGPKAVAKKK